MPMLVPARPSRPCRWRLRAMNPLRGALSTCLRPPPSTMETWKGSSWMHSTSPVPAAHPVTGRTQVERSQRVCCLNLFIQVCSLSPRRPQSPDQDEGQITFDVEMCSPRHSQVRHPPSTVQSPLRWVPVLLSFVCFQSGEDSPEPSREDDAPLNKEADWVADWSSRPENIPPK